MNQYCPTHHFPSRPGPGGERAREKGEGGDACRGERSFLEAILEIMENIEKLENKKGCVRREGEGPLAAAARRAPRPFCSGRRACPASFAACTDDYFVRFITASALRFIPGRRGLTENSLFVLFPSLSLFVRSRSSRSGVARRGLSEKRHSAAGPTTCSPRLTPPAEPSLARGDGTLLAQGSLAGP